MSRLIEVILSLDPLAVGFLVGSFALLFAIVRVLMNPLDLESPSREEAPPADRSGGPEEKIETPSAPAPAPPSTPRSPGSRRRSAA